MTPAIALASPSVSVPARGSLDALRRRLSGELVTPDSPQYDTARKTPNYRFDRYPLAIVRAAGAEDVVQAVRFANAYGYPLAVRGGGHSIAGHSSVDGALVIDLGGLRDVRIDPARGVARVQAGATSGDLAGPANAHGLALSTGDTSSVGLGGLTTGGGIGFLVRKHGLAIDNLLSAEVVTADGSRVVASADSHPDLFWAIRGGGGNFGVVTEFEFQLAPVDTILGGALVLPGTLEVLRGYLDYVATAPDDLTTIANLMHAPPAPFIPQDRVGERVLVVLVAWTGETAAGEAALAPLRALATPVADAVSVIPYPAIYHFTQEAARPHGAAVRAMYAHAFSDAHLQAALDAMDRATSPLSMVQFRGLGGAMADVDPAATAFVHRDKPYFAAVLGLWPDASDAEAPHRAWTEALWEELRPAAQGVYVNFLEDEGEARVREAYSDQTLRRLESIKLRYDPTNLFQFNQNVTPRP